MACASDCSGAVRLKFGHEELWDAVSLRQPSSNRVLEPSWKGCENFSAGKVGGVVPMSLLRMAFEEKCKRRLIWAPLSCQ